MKKHYLVRIDLDGVPEAETGSVIADGLRSAANAVGQVTTYEGLLNGNVTHEASGKRVGSARYVPVEAPAAPGAGGGNLSSALGKPFSPPVE